MFPHMQKFGFLFGSANVEAFNPSHIYSAAKVIKKTISSDKKKKESCNRWYALPLSTDLNFTESVCNSTKGHKQQTT